MAVTMADVMRACRNFFETGYQEGTFTIADGAISPHTLLTVGTVIAITGSVLNDGVYTIGEGCQLTGAEDEQFTGRVWFLHPPVDFKTLYADIAVQAAKMPETTVVSESFGSYSHTNATGQNGAVLGWKEVFADRLMPYRRMFTEVGL